MQQLLRDIFPRRSNRALLAVAGLLVGTAMSGMYPVVGSHAQSLPAARTLDSSTYRAQMSPREPLFRSPQPHPFVLTFGSTFDAHIGYAAIPVYDNGASCGTFTHGNATGPSISLGTKLPILGSWLQFAPEILYRSLSTTFETRPSTIEHGFQAGVGLVTVDRVRTYDATLSALSAALLLDVATLPWLHFSLGPEVGFLPNHSYTETEHIVSPSNATYLSASGTTKTISSGSLAVNALQAGLGVGMSVAVPIGDFTIWPQVRASIPFTNISTANTTSWRTYTIGGGISLSRTFMPEIPARPSTLAFENASQVELPNVDGPKPRPSVLRVAVQAIGIGKHGEAIAAPTLTIERVRVTEAFPTLNCVFFDDGSRSIPDRYHQFPGNNQASGFDEHSLNELDAMAIHHSVLDVIGSRLASNHSASITLVGSRSEASPLDRDASAGNAQSELAASRAHAVAGYLERVWNIDSSRITVTFSALPDFPSDESTSAGQAENRRVEILSSSSDILAPVWTEKWERVASPPKILFNQEIKSSHGIASFRITVRQGTRILQTFDGSSDGAAGDHLWTLADSTSPDGNDSLTYVDEVVDSTGQVATASGVIHLRTEERDTSHHATRVIGGRHVERYSLILFDYSSSQFGKRQAELLIDTIARAIDPGSALTLTGHTDRTGDAAYNNRLSGMRVSTTADALKERLKRIRRPIPTMSVEAHGSRDILFDNSEPEGRFLSRTVRITVEHGE